MTVTYLHEHTSLAQAQKRMADRRKRFEKKERKRVDYHEPDIYNEEVDTMSKEYRYIRAKNTQTLYKMDVEDWKLAKDIPWYEGAPGDLHTFQGQSFESYVGIVGLRKHPFGPHDKRRENYHGA